MTQETINLDEIDKEDLCNFFDINEENCNNIDLINNSYNSLIADIKASDDDNKTETIKFITKIKDKLIDLINQEKETNKEIYDELNNNSEKKRQITNSYPVTIKKDILNPNFKNSTFRIVNIDSQYRNTILPYNQNDMSAPSSNTHFKINLTEPLNNVLSMKLYSIQIPYSWYIFDTNLGNNFFYIKDYDSSYVKIEIESGNYDASGLVSEVNKQLVNNNYDSSLNVTYNVNNGKASFNYTGTTDISLIFYDNNGFYSTNTPFTNGSQINYNLGWHLGFRENQKNKISYIDLTTPGISGESIIDVIGPKYLFLVVDDCNNNHLNRGIINIDFADTKCDLPSSYNLDLNLTSETSNILNVEAAAPRRTTKAILTTINAIQQNKKNIKNRLLSPTNSDILAIIPINKNKLTFNDLIVELGSTLQINKRSYFGPVDIEKLKISLLDDKGQYVNLNGLDWSFSLITEHLYQYS